MKKKSLPWLEWLCLLVPPNPEALADAIIYLLENEDVKENMGGV